MFCYFIYIHIHLEAFWHFKQNFTSYLLLIVTVRGKIMHMITKKDWFTFTEFDYLVLLSLTHHINIESNNQNLTKEIWLFSGFRPFPSIILKYGILSWLMKEKRTFVNGNCIEQRTAQFISTGIPQIPKDN